MAHVKALLSRASAARAAAVPATAAAATAQIVSFISAKGGVGTTTVALNFAAVAAQTGKDVLLADLHSGSGSLGLMLGLASKQNLGSLLTRPVGEVDQRAVTEQIAAHVSGVRVLTSAAEPTEISLGHNATQTEALVKTAGRLCKLLVLDLGSGLSEAARRVAPLSDLVVVVGEPTRLALTQTKALITSLTAQGVANIRLEIIMVNRTPSTLQIGWPQAEQILGSKIATIITPAPELAYQAVEAGTPMVLLRADSLTADQLRKMTNQLLEKMSQ